VPCNISGACIKWCKCVCHMLVLTEEQNWESYEFWWVTSLQLYTEMNPAVLGMEPVVEGTWRYCQQGWAGVAQSVQCLATGWTTGQSRFDPRQRRKDFSSSLCVQTGSGAHPASCPMGTGGPFPGGKARPGRDADHSPHLVPRSRMSRSYNSSPPSASVACSGTALLLI
jgi:hypothetical protein